MSEKSGASTEEAFVVGIGASAGGFEAIAEILNSLTDLTGLTLIVVQHLDPNHESHLVELLRQHTKAPVRWTEHGARLEPGVVYVAPPHTGVNLQNRVLLLEPSDKRPSSGITFFFHALARDVRDYAVGVVLSGQGRDGAEGARAIQAAGGLTFAQEPSTARFMAMPRAAIDAHAVDRVLSPTGIAKELLKLTEDSRRLRDRIPLGDEEVSSKTDTEELVQLFRVLASRTGVDFSGYKQSTINRRLMRRMLLAKTPDLGDYLKLLQKSRSEVQELYESLLINVTEFFRDPECLEFLQTSIFPGIVEQHSDGAPIRVWTPGCSTGEETYSLAILLREALEPHGAGIPVQIFGTDVSDHAITRARAGFYSNADFGNVSPERRERFFEEVEGGYVVRKSVRDMCIFARQNVVKDSPFSRLDLLCCRNLLIYFGPSLQRRLMPIFHYALNPTGHLVLGSSESVGAHTDLYRLVDRRFRIYSRKSSTRRPPLDFAPDPSLAAVATPKAASSLMSSPSKDPIDIVREADRIVLGRHGPAGVLVNEELDILQFRGDVSAYLAPPPGRASLNLARMVRDGLLSEVQLAIQQAREQNIRIRKAGIAFVAQQGAREVDIDITPIELASTRERFFLVLFGAPESSAAAEPAAKPSARKTQPSAQLEKMQQDLEVTRNYLQSTIEKHEATNQELRAANEEIQSSNEELQSTNEELETAKEELQSTNEELTTVNEELHSRQLDLIQLNNDLHNLVNSVQLPIVILGQDMRIRRFTPAAEKVLNVIPTDIGRPLSDLNINLTVKDLPGMVAEVVDTLTIRELEVQDGGGRWYSLRLRPYRTADNKIDGVVLTLIDIDALKRTFAEAEEARIFAQAVIETTREPLVALTADLRIKSANEAFFRLFKTSKEHAQSRSLFEAVKDGDKLIDLRRMLEGILPTNSSLTNYESEIDLPGRGLTPVTIDVRQIASSVRTYPLILLSIRLS